MQLVIFIVIIITVTSIVTLLLTISNITGAFQGVTVSALTYSRVNDLSEATIMLRSLFNIANGYDNATSSTIADRVTFFSQNVMAALESVRLA